MLYGSSTLALACLEVLVHIRNVGLIPTDYVYCEVEVPEVLVTPWNLTGEEALGKIESPVLAREYGDRWFSSTILSRFREESLSAGSKLPAPVDTIHRSPAGFGDPNLHPTPVQAVPSVIISREMNYLISPVHPQFDQLVWGDPQPFRFDPRLIKSMAE
jgi:hypothetical protein